MWEEDDRKRVDMGRLAENRCSSGERNGLLSVSAKKEATEEWTEVSQRESQDPLTDTR